MPKRSEVLKNVYDVNVRHGGICWLVDVPAVGRTTQARHLREAEAMARDLIAVMLDVETQSFDVSLHIELPAAARQHLAKVAQLREEEARARSAAAAESRAAARELRDAGLPLRDFGRALGVSHQRAAQLISGQQT